MRNDDVCRVSVATFSAVAGRYAEKYFDLDVYDPYLERFEKRIGIRGASVLDVACGPGTVSAYLAKVRPDLKLVGIDLAEGMIQQARLRVPSAEFHLEDCRRIKDFGRTFDAAAFAFGLSYLTDDDVRRFFDSLNATVSESAVRYLATMTGEPRRSGIQSTADGHRVYLQYRSSNDVAQLVERAGYRIEFSDLIESPASAPERTQDLILIAQRN
jgi:SAM-dependent methyltransferase